jgi:hypothetical protein
MAASVLAAHIGPQYTALFDQWVAFQLDALGKAALYRFGRHFDALPRNVEFPAVVWASQAALFVAPEPQRCAAMRAEFVDQAIAALAVAKRDQPLRKEFHPHRRAVVFRQFLRQQCRSPVAAEQLTHRGTGTRLGDELVLLFPQHLLLHANGKWNTNHACSTNRCFERDQICAHCGPKLSLLKFDLDQGMRSAVHHNFFLTTENNISLSQGKTIMPLESVFALTAVTIAFVGFALALCGPSTKRAICTDPRMALSCPLIAVESP